jgi:UDPglucose--hexose-1-phosphate uridylyltransferase
MTQFETPLKTQSETQIYLEEIFHQKDFNSALDALYQLEYDYGYLTDAKLMDNLRYEYLDPETGVIFRTQINIARSNYTPAPLSGKDIPKLHCPICFENIGLPGKENLRVFEFLLSGKAFFAQLTPFPLYPKHFVLVSKAKTPMIMDHRSIEDMINFVKLAPGYSVFSNSDVEWAGASVLVHHHYQAIQNLKLPITEAQIIPEFSISIPSTHHETTQTQIGLLDFPIASCLIQSTNSDDLIHYGQKIIAAWRTQDPLNTCNLALHTEKNFSQEEQAPLYCLFIIFRNPAYRTPESLNIIKSEGVGIIEVCGEGIYPVPKEPAIAQRIKQDGLNIIKGIIDGNNPVPREKLSELFGLFFK